MQSLTLTRRDIENMHTDIYNDKKIEEIEIPIDNTSFLDVIANYEDVQFKSYNAYNNIDDKMPLEHRLSSIIRELNSIKNVCLNALDRIQHDINPNKIHAIRLLTEKEHEIQ